VTGPSIGLDELSEKWAVRGY